MDESVISSDNEEHDSNITPSIKLFENTETKNTKWDFVIIFTKIDIELLLEFCLDPKHVIFVTTYKINVRLKR